MAAKLIETMNDELATALKAMMDAVQAWLRWQGSEGEHITHVLEPLETYMLDFRISGSPHAWCIDGSDDTMNLICCGEVDESELWVPIENVGYKPRVK